VKKETLDKAVALARTLDHVLVATSDSCGVPHLAAAQTIASVSHDQISITSWYCPGTLKNLEENGNMAIVVWSKAAGTGYQLVGRVVGVKDRAIMNGFAPAIEDRDPLPEIEKEFLVRVDRIVSFHPAAHSDVEE
jgi:uncharacterized protein